MGLQETYVVVATLFLATHSSKAATIQAAVDLGEDSRELLQMIFKHIEKLGHRKVDGTSLTPGHTELASALLQVAPVVTIKGNITDPERRLTITFTLQASHLQPDSSSYAEDDDDDDEDDWDYNWRGSGGVFHPIVDIVEPYVMGLVELVFNGILSNVIGRFLESTSLVGDVRIV